MMKSILLFGALTAAIAGLNAQTTVFLEEFNTVDGSTMLAPNWAWQDLNGNAGRWRSGDFTSATAAIGFSGNTAYCSGNNFDVLLASPAISIPAGASTLTYKVALSSFFGSGSANSTYNVYVLPASSTFTSTLTPLFTETITTVDTISEKTIDLSSFAGQAVKIYFRHFNSGIKYLFMDDVKVTSSSVLATSETQNKAQTGIYPNPATDFISIKSKSEIISTEVYDATGRKVGSQLKSDKVDVRNLLPGSYILNINTKEGKTSSKFIKKD
ncbi:MULTISPECIES: T9SS-dependent choice-of-anchor J family protein [Chryseobacterium]|uniref:Secretion system C-terminal sorting domain-containing protein n=1 Tax=Chryseobacterium geocarposphaerae TaxID=1416776 RepID=A0ABU1LCN4_9FLAO|nr:MULTISPECIES: T9SS type A sorting domain-containing protein [Chryseobacterium]ALR30473.1 hypothetical protein ATE47_08000 [Chryseobacterium sp. IHB B 17019]MDR6404360.1 hypothetical protein [Chryseobacterium geocarposphaerae]MDR6699775.1 hypothetical protein [Chryseobacterium ginsenosidimutans]